jgi:hypothetical protein
VPAPTVWRPHTSGPRADSKSARSASHPWRRTRSDLGFVFEGHGRCPAHMITSSAVDQNPGCRGRAGLCGSVAARCGGHKRQQFRAARGRRMRVGGGRPTGVPPDSFRPLPGREAVASHQPGTRPRDLRRGPPRRSCSRPLGGRRWHGGGRLAVGRGAEMALHVGQLRGHITDASAGQITALRKPFGCRHGGSVPFRRLLGRFW